jgi:DNA-directed RNA polymerase subunit E'/Rpb7
MKNGIFADLGPLSIFIPVSRLPDSAQFISDQAPHYVIPATGDNDGTARAIKQQSLIKIRIEQIQMLDDNYLPTNTTSCVLKAMGTLIDF